MPLHDTESEIIDRTKIDAFKAKKSAEEQRFSPPKYRVALTVVAAILFAVTILAPLAEYVWLDRHFPKTQPILDAAGALRGWFMERF